MTIRRPMKPATLSDLALEDIDGDDIPFPVYGTPKFDGIRCCVQSGQALTYKLKRIPNKYVRRKLEMPGFEGLDGELIVTHSIQDYFNNTQSGVMSHDGEPDFKFCVFDVMPKSGKPDPGYLRRVDDMFKTQASFLQYVEPVKIRNMRELLSFERDCLKKNYEGFVLRTGNSPYKYGRSTLSQFWMVKYKRFHDSEARVTGFNELMANKNEAKRNKYTNLIERSSHKKNMVPMNMLGSLNAVDLKTGVEFRISGFTLKQRKQIWRQRKKKMGAIFTYRYQLHGMKDKPRFDVFKGWRPENES